MNLKLNVLLAKSEHAAGQFKRMLSDYVAFFKTKQGEFKGVKKTYAPKEGTVDEPTMRANVSVVTTTEEKLQWLEDTAKEYIDNLFSTEATNASGSVKAALTVDGVDFGHLSSLELLRLKSLLESGDLEQLYANIPVRSDAEIWNKTNAGQYQGRNVYESPLQSGVKKSLTKESYILSDPNIGYLKDTSKYVPQVSTKDTVLELGEYTVQHFSGESTHRERAEILKRRSKLLSAVIEALKIANEAEAIPSTITAAKLFGYLHKGK